MKKIVIFNQKVAGYLMLKGFTLKKLEKNHVNSKMNVFVFNDSHELRTEIGKYDNFVRK